MRATFVRSRAAAEKGGGSQSQNPSHREHRHAEEPGAGRGTARDHTRGVSVMRRAEVVTRFLPFVVILAKLFAYHLLPNTTIVIQCMLLLLVVKALLHMIIVGFLVVVVRTLMNTAIVQHILTATSRFVTMVKASRCHLVAL